MIFSVFLILIVAPLTQSICIVCSNPFCMTFMMNVGYLSPFNHINCIKICTKHQSEYALFHKNHCFCATASQAGVIASLTTDASFCSISCPNATDVKCGGEQNYKKYMSVHKILKETYVVVQTNLPDGMSMVQDEISISSVKLDTLPLPFEWDVIMDSNKLGLKLLNTTSTTSFFHLPGLHTIQMDMLAGQDKSMMVDLGMEPKGILTLDCPQMVLLGEKAVCNLTVQSGKNLKFNIVFGDSTQQTFPMADPEMGVHGPPLLELQQLSAGSHEEILFTQPFPQDGFIVAVENVMLTQVSTRKLDLIVFNAPSAYQTNSQKTCAVGNFYCLFSLACESANTCSTKPIYADIGLSFPNVQTSQLYACGLKNRNFFAFSTPLPVKEGQTFGTSRTLSGLGTRLPLPGEASWNGRVPMMNVLTFTPRGVMVEHQYGIEGNMEVVATVDNNLFPRSSITNTTTITVSSPINDSTIIAPSIWPSNQSLTLTLKPHTGFKLTYTWNITDREGDVNTTTPTLTINFMSLGCQKITCLISNMVSSMMSAEVEVCVEEYLGGLKVVSNKVISTGVDGQFNVSLAYGNHYVCTWNHGLGAEINETEQQLLLASRVHKHQYQLPGLYSLSVTCFNNISRVSFSFDQLVEYPITNIQLVKEGAVKNLPIKISFTIDEGKNCIFTLKFDGLAYPVIWDDTAKTGSTRDYIKPYTTNLVVPVVITGTNYLGTETKTFDFYIETAITGLTLSCNPPKVNSSQTFSCQASVATGTSFQFQFNFNDSTTDKIISLPFYSPTPSSQTVSHSYSYSGQYFVTVVVSSHAEELTRNFTVIVSGAIGKITLSDETLTPRLKNVFDPIPSYHNELCFKLSSPTFMTNIYVNISYGNGNSSHSLLYDHNKLYCHFYVDEGTFIIKYTAYNNQTFASFSTPVIILTPISSLAFVYNMPAAGYMWSHKFGVTMETGSNVTLMFDFGDGSPVITVLRKGKTVVEPDFQFHTYQKTGIYFVKVYAFNYRSKVNMTYEMKVLHPLTDSFYLLHNSPIPSSSSLLNITLYYPSDLFLPQEVTVITDYNEPLNYPIKQQLDWLLAPPVNLTSEFLATLQPPKFPTSTTLRFYPFNFLYTYQTSGIFNISIFMFNLASNVTYNISAAILTPITGVAATYLYHPVDTPPSNLVPGLGPDMNVYPFTREIICKATYTGTLLQVRLKVVHLPTSEVTTLSFEPASSFIFSVPKTGTYRVTLTMVNDFGPVNHTTTLTSAHIPTKILMNINPSTVPPAQIFSINFTFDDLNLQSSCLTVTITNVDTSQVVHKFFYGSSCSDPTSSPITNPLIIQKSLSTFGTFEVTSVYKDNLIQDLKTTPALLTISDSDCQRPQVSITKASKDWFNPVKFVYSETATFSGSVKIICPAATKNSKVWKVHRVDPATGNTLLRVLEIANLTSHTSSSLLIPAKFLSVGLYLATYNVSMEFPGFYQVVKSYFEIIGSPIVASMTKSGLSSFKLGREDFLELSPALYSIDPDFVGTTPKFDSFTWYCRLLNESLPLNPDGSIESKAYMPVPTITSSSVITNRNLGGCFSFGPGHLAIESGVLRMSGQVFKANEVYVFKCIVRSGVREDNDEVKVEVVEGSVPQLEMGCSDSKLCSPSSGYKVISSTFDLKVYSKCVDRCREDMSFTWTAQKQTLSLKWIDIPDFTQDFVIGSYPNEVLIKKLLFEKSILYVEAISNTARIRVTATTEETEATMELEVTRSPWGGSCHVSPLHGTSMQSKFKFFCQNWRSEYPIKQYIFYLKSPYDTTKKVELGGNAEGVLQGLTLASSPSNGTHAWWQLGVDVIDGLSSVTHYLSIDRLQVDEMSADQIDDLLSSLSGGDSASDSSDLFTSLAAEGDMMQICQYFSALGSALESDLENKMDSYGGGQPYPNDAAAASNEYQKLRERNAQLRTQMLEAVNTITPLSIEDIGMVTNTLASITNAPSELSRNVQATATKRMDSLMETFDILSDDASLESLTDVAKGITSFVGNLLAGTNFGIKDGTVSDLEAAAQGPYYFYDTDYNSDRAELPADPNQAMRILRSETNSIEQKASARRFVARLNKMIDSMGGILRKRLVPGIPPLEISTESLDVSLGKTMPADIASQKLNTRGSKVQLPAWTQLTKDEEGSQKAVSLQLTATKENIFQFFKNTKKVPVSSSIVSLDMYEEGGQTKKIKNTSAAIKLTIPRKTPFPPPSKLNLSEAAEVTAQLIHFAADISFSFSAIHLIINNDYKNKVVEQDSNYTLLSYSNEGFGDRQNTNKTDVKSNVGNGTEMFVVGDWPVYLVLGSYLEPAEQNESIYQWDYIKLLPAVVENKLSFSFMVPSDVVSNKTGQWFVGLRQLQEEEIELCTKGDVTKLKAKKSKELVGNNLETSFFTSGCNYNPNDGKDLQWNADSSCKVSVTTTEETQACECYHLTSFGGSFAVQPNKIDISFVLQNSSFAQNMTLYLTEICICVLYLFLLVWARYQDKKDVLKSGLTPLLDNNIDDKYLYEVVVNTGMRRNAGTDSKVSILLSGEREETPAKKLEDGIRKPFSTGAVDQFLLSVPRPLGELLYLKIWHDNSGKKNKAGWFLDSVCIRDIQTSQKFFFLIDNWLALEYDDGQISRLVPVASQQQLTVSKHIFNKKAAKGFVDDHLWFSIVSSRASSRFTRVQRLSCCLCLLFSVMFANAMFYGTTDQSSPNKLDIGVFSISMEQIYVGFISNFIVFPINFIIALLFKKSRDRIQKGSKISQALKIMQKRSNEKTGKKESEEEKVEGMKKQKETNVNTYKESFTDVDDTRSDDVSLVANDENTKKDGKKKKKKKFMLPWWCKIIAWGLLWLATAGGVVGVTFYGIMFQDEKVKKWLTSLVISIITSIFLTQPIKILLAAMLFAIIFKKPIENEEEEEEEEEDEENKHLAHDEEWVHEKLLNDCAKSKTLQDLMPDSGSIRKIREKRLKEVRLHGALKEVLLYCIFLWATITISYQFKQPEDYRIKWNLERIFSGKINLEVKTMEDFWAWLETIVNRGLRSEKFYNGMQPFGLRGHLVDTVSRLMGFATLRQLRVQKNACKVPIYMKNILDICNVPYSFEKEDMNDYYPGWMPMSNTTSPAFTIPLNTTHKFPHYFMSEFVYRSAKSLNSLPVFGTHALYRGGGYVAELKGTLNQLQSQVARLKESRWIDQYTRAVFLEFSVYNVHSNLFGIVTVVFELLNTGGFEVYERIDSVNLLTSASVIFYISLAIYVVLTIYYSILEIILFVKLKKAYFKRFWSWVEVTNLVLSIGSVAIYVIRFFQVEKILKVFRETAGNGYIRLQEVAAWHELLLSFVSLVVFLSTLKLIKILRFNKNIGLFGSTLSYASKYLASFSIIFCIIFFAFVQLFYLVYIQSLVTFSSFTLATQQCLQMLVGKFDFQDMKRASPYFGTFIFFAFMTILAFILLTLFITIVTEAFQVVRSNVQKQSNEHEVVDFLFDKIKEALGRRKMKMKSSVAPRITSKNLKEQIESLDAQFDSVLRILSRKELNATERT